MKNTKKHSLFNFKTIIILSAIIAVVMSFTFTTIASAEKNTVMQLKTASEMVRFSKKQYENETFNDNYEPYGIGKAILKEGDKETNVYVVTLLGTKFAYDDSGWQATDIFTDVLAGFDLNNPYVTNVKTSIVRDIPKGSKLILSGHSLGGMVAQELAADTYIKNNFQVLHTLTFGSPLCAYYEGRAGQVVRLCDTWDPIPLLSKYTLTDYDNQLSNTERRVGDGNYGFFSMISCHTKSYSRDDVWGMYDALGYYHGNHEIIVDYTGMKYYPNPMF